MYIRKLLLLFPLIFISCRLAAATFTVTSNADAGPATLRQALLDAAANGAAATDYIYFNLPGNTQAAVTITLLSQLPDVTANVVIDGTTQPGLALGASNAKVIITPATPAANLSAFIISTLVLQGDIVQFYGLYIKGFSPNQVGLGNAIVTNANCLLVVGSPGKGNVICGNGYAFDGHFQNAVIQSNFIGIEPDGITPFNNSSVFYSGQDYNNLLIGGAAAQDGNVILSGTVSGINLGGITGNTNKNIATIQNNYFNTDYTGTKSISAATNSCILADDPLTLLFVIGNVFSAREVAVTGVHQSAFIIKGNFFGTDKSQTFPLGAGVQAIDNSNVNSIIGGPAAADQNVFTNYQNPISAYNNSYTNVVQNSFYCNSAVQLNDPSGKNFIRITSLTNTSVAGDAPPGATVQLYYTQIKCSTCNPNTWFATVTANTVGAWQYTGNTMQNVLASSTLFNNTVGFQFDSLAQSEVTILNYDCHHAGSITLKEKRQGRIQPTWTDSKGAFLGNGQSVINLQPGTYTLKITEGGACLGISANFTVIDLTPKVFAQTFQLNCNNPTGYFAAFPATGPGISVAKYYWTDANGKILSTKNTVTNLTAGNYYLYITDSNGCNSAKALCQVLPATPAPVIDDSKAMVADASCGFANGSVTAITLTNAGNANYGWSRPDGTQLAFGQLNLTNAPAGQYYFFVDYNFNCPPVKSKVFTIKSVNVITLDVSAVIIAASTCSNSNGSIKGITAAGATAYQWFNSNNKSVGNAADLLNVVSGNYYLVASNATCSSQTSFYTINNTPAVNNFPSTVVSADATCGQNNGSVTVTFDAANAPLFYRWVDKNGATLFKDAPLTNAASGIYQLFVTDGNGCESLYQSYTVHETPLIQIVAGTAQIMNDQCGQLVGSIKNITVTGGVQPYVYNWTNSAQQSISSTIGLAGIGKGVYTVQVKDATACGMATQNFIVTEESAFVAAPEFDNLQLCSAGEALLFVKNPQPGYGYRLYDTQNSTAVLAENTNGQFNIAVTSSRSFYATQYTGDCESARVEIKVTIGLSGLSIPNTFSPNNDGINDFWAIKGIANYPNVLVQIFNRYGQKIFESKGYGQPFDGKTGGSLLQPGVYYYIINLNSSCSLLSGSLTLIR